jgi:hypothetical protein
MDVRAFCVGFLAGVFLTRVAVKPKVEVRYRYNTEYKIKYKEPEPYYEYTG